HGRQDHDEHGEEPRRHRDLARARFDREILAQHEPDLPPPGRRARNRDIDERLARPLRHRRCLRTAGIMHHEAGAVPTTTSDANLTPAATSTRSPTWHPSKAR